MQNQAAVEALYSATFMEDYLDFVENLPNNVQIYVSRLREFDLVQYTEFLKDLDSLVSSFEKETTAAGQRAILAKIQHGLIAAQDIGDDKLSSVQAMSDLIDTRMRQIDHEAKNLDFNKDDKEDIKLLSHAAPSAPANNIHHGSVVKPPSSAKTCKNKAGPIEKPEKQVKRRKKSIERKMRESTVSLSAVNVEEPSQAKSSYGSGTKNRTSAGRKPISSATVQINVKRKQTKRATATHPSSSNVKDDSDNDNGAGIGDIDPDEPTYCLCEQISYGEMIGCDNDLCPIEWFHFSCVQLSTKPKGKWFCPKCRGDKPTLMKPKAQFLKELDKYNKERALKHSA